MTPLRLLQVEDSEGDAALVERSLERFGFEVTSLRVDSVESFRAAIEQNWDVVICDYRLGGFTAPLILNLLNESGKDLPFIVVSGTIGEDTAVQMMLSGAHDYLLKDNLARLGPAVAREIKEARGRKARVDADSALRESERRLTLALDAARMGVWEWHFADGTVLWSERKHEIFGMPTFDHRIETFFSLIHPEDVEDVRSGMDRAIEGKEIFRYEFRIIRPDGSFTWISNVARADYDDQQRPWRMVGTVEDITERKAAHAELLSQRAMLQSVLSSALDAVISIDKDGLVVLWNAAAERMFGYSPHEAEGRRLDELIISAADRQAFQDEVERFHPRGNAARLGSTLEMLACRRDGSKFPVEINLGAVDLPGSVGAVGVVRDISHRKHAEQSLRDSEERWQFALEGSGAGVFDWRAETNHAYWSPRAKAMLGFEENELGDGVLEWDRRLHPDDRARAHSEISAHLAGETPGYSCEFRLLCKDGTYKWILGSGKVVSRDNDGSALRLIGTHADITDRKNAEVEREKLYAQYLHAQKMESVGRLAGGIAHDFNNLLTVINGYSSLLLRGIDKGNSMHDALQQISHSGERAAALVRQLLAFSRKEKPERKLLNANELVLAMERSLLRLVGDDVQVVTNLEPDIDSVLADRHQMEQVIMNLAVNARDAMPDGGMLSIETAREWREGTCSHCRLPITPEFYIRISVRDNGSGIDESIRDRLFEPFFTTKDVGKGTGLGLSVVEGIVAENGGHLKLESVVDEGTVIHVFLPALTGDAEKEVPDHGAEAHGRGAILLVEDELEVRRLIASVLELCGYRIVTAGTSAEAISQLESLHFDLLITDVKMPGTGGIELAARAVRQLPHLKVMFISGYLDGALELPPGARFVRKPLDLDKFSADVRDLMNEGDRKGSVLVVDDEPSIRRFMRVTLEQAGYQVSEAEDGLDASRQLKSFTPDVVITDLVMPEREGIETIEIIRREYPGVKVIAMSGAAGGKYLALAKMLGASGTLVKPLGIDRLLAQVRAALDSK